MELGVMSPQQVLGRTHVVQRAWIVTFRFADGKDGVMEVPAGIAAEATEKVNAVYPSLTVLTVTLKGANK